MYIIALPCFLTFLFCFRGYSETLITEVFNGETKRQAGPHRSGFSTNVDAVNTWIKTTHIHAKLRKKFNDTIRLTTDSHHKETTQSEMKRHSQHVKNLNDQLKKYNTNPFGDGPKKLFDPIKKANLDTGIKSKRRANKASAILKTDKRLE